MVYKYPYVNHAGEDISVDDVHYFMKSPRLVAKRVAELAAQRFLSDYLLRGRFNAEGGGITYLIDDGLYSDHEAEAISPGGGYPLTTASEGTPETAVTEKEGQDAEVTDESIARMQMDPVNRTLNKVVNHMVKRVDGKNLAVIASEVTATHTGAAWTSAEAIIEDVLIASAKVEALDLGLSPDVAVLKPLQFAKVAAKFVKADLVAKGVDQIIASGVIPNVLGKTWATSNHVPFNDPFLVDGDQLGGIGIENIKSPGYTKVSGSLGIETKVWRPTDDDRDQYRVRVRRVGLGVVIEPRAGIRITGTGL